MHWNVVLTQLTHGEEQLSHFLSIKLAKVPSGHNKMQALFIKKKVDRQVKQIKLDVQSLQGDIQ